VKTIATVYTTGWLLQLQACDDAIAACSLLW